MTVYEELIKATELAKFWTAEEKRLKAIIINDYLGEVEAYDQNGQKFKIAKVTKNLVALREDVTMLDIKQRFGDDYIKMTPDMDALKKNPNAHDILEIKPSSYISVRALKSWDIDDEEL